MKDPPTPPHLLPQQVTVLKSSHVGGHVHAGNVLVYGGACNGDWFGGVNANNAADFLASVLGAKVRLGVEEVAMAGRQPPRKNCDQPGCGWLWLAFPWALQAELTQVKHTGVQSRCLLPPHLALCCRAGGGQRRPAAAAAVEGAGRPEQGGAEGSVRGGHQGH